MINCFFYAFGWVRISWVPCILIELPISKLFSISKILDLKSFKRPVQIPQMYQNPTLTCSHGPTMQLWVEFGGFLTKHGARGGHRLTMFATILSSKNVSILRK